MILILSCTALKHGYTSQRFQGRLLPATTGPGLERFILERGVDLTLEAYTDDHGSPDYIYVVDRNTVQLIYVSSDVVATFRRRFTSNGSVTVAKGIPLEVASQIPALSRAALRPEEPPASSTADAAPRAGPEPAAQPAVMEPQFSFGTCFAVRATGWAVLTSHHVVAGAKSVLIRFPTQDQVLDVVDVRNDPDNDLSLLKVEEPLPGVLPLGKANAAALGDRLFTIGFPAPDALGFEPKFAEGALSSLYGLHDQVTQFQISIPIQPGNSGGPVINSSGEVIGVIAATVAAESFLRNGALPQNVNYAVKAEYAAGLLLDSEPPVALPGSRARAIETARKATCQVITKR